MRTVRSGFTLVELIVVVVIIGIIAAIAIAKFVTVKEAAYVASMKSDLRNFAIYEQFYATENGGSYFTGDGIVQGFTPSLDVSVSGMASPGPPPSWTATAVHVKTPKKCSTVANPSTVLISCL